MLHNFPSCTELADMVKAQSPQTIHALSKWAYDAFMGYNCVVAGDRAQERFEEPLIAIYLAGFYAHAQKEEADDEELDELFNDLDPDEQYEVLVAGLKARGHIA